MYTVKKALRTAVPITALVIVNAWAIAYYLKKDPALFYAFIAGTAAFLITYFAAVATERYTLKRLSAPISKIEGEVLLTCAGVIKSGEKSSRGMLIAGENSVILSRIKDKKIVFRTAFGLPSDVCRLDTDGVAVIFDDGEVLFVPYDTEEVKCLFSETL